MTCNSLLTTNLLQVGKTCYPHACCKLFQQVVTGVHIMYCNKPISNRVVVETCKNAQVVTDLVTSCIHTA